MRVSDTERSKYDKVWQHPDYRRVCHSLQLWEQRRELFPSFSSALDIGCGLAYLVDVWNGEGLDAWGVDISVESTSRDLRNRDKIKYCCLWDMEWDARDDRFDFGICTDVMEHIPPKFVSATLSRISDCCSEVLFKIAHEESNFMDEELHLSIRPVKWWLHKLNNVGGESEFLGTERRSGCEDSLVRWRT